MKFLKPGPDPPPLPREPRLKTLVPLEDLKAFKEAFGQETGASTADLLQELDSTLELAYTVKETLDQDEALKTALISVGIGADTVERYNSMLQEMLQKILPIAQQICKILKRRAKQWLETEIKMHQPQTGGTEQTEKEPPQGGHATQGHQSYRQRSMR